MRRLVGTASISVTEALGYLSGTGFTRQALFIGSRRRAPAGWIDRRKSFFYVRAYSRRYATLYRVEAQGGGAQVTPVVLPNLLMHLLLNVAPGSETAARRHIDLELEALAVRKSG